MADHLDNETTLRVKPKTGSEGFTQYTQKQAHPSDGRVYSQNASSNNGPVKISSQFMNPLWRNTMLVQMIELEEITMMQVSDDALELNGLGYGTNQQSNDYIGSTCTSACNSDC